MALTICSTLRHLTQSRSHQKLVVSDIDQSFLTILSLSLSLFVNIKSDLILLTSIAEQVFQCTKTFSSSFQPECRTKNLHWKLHYCIQCVTVRRGCEREWLRESGWSMKRYEHALLRNILVNYCHITEPSVALQPRQLYESCALLSFIAVANKNAVHAIVMRINGFSVSGTQRT